VGVRFGRYELLGLLGRGGMAEVFLARYSGPEGFEKRLVIKRVLPQLGGDRRFLKLFFDEARTQVSLSHGNLVPVFDFGRVANAYFIAMEHVPGCDLGQLLARSRERPLEPRLVAHIGAELLRGLDYVHRRGFVHRDVAPRNVLLSRDGEVKLSDFGVALAASNEAAGVRGTVAYMAPEQARGERIDGRADLYALALVLAEALTGKRVRPPAGDEQALEQARAGGPLSVDGPLGPVLARATQAATADRWPDAESMLLALEQAASSLERGTAAPARDLATRVADVSPNAGHTLETATELPPGTAATAGEETYFRDRETDSFVDEVLASPAPAPRRRAWLLGAVAGGVALAGAVLTWRAVGHERPAAPPVVAQQAPEVSHPAGNVLAGGEGSAPAPAHEKPAPAPANVNVNANVNANAHPAVKRKPSGPVGSGTLQVHCTPWCVPVVDGQRRGEDGRNHKLALSAGTHRLVLERLEDRQERTVRIEPDAVQTVDVTFE
jgi:serine/threonine protein kinase